MLFFSEAPLGLYIRNQTYNATGNWLDFCINMWRRIIYMKYIAQLLTKNLLCTASNVSTARFAKP